MSEEILEDNPTPKKWHLIGGRIPRVKLAPELRKRRERSPEEEVQGSESIREKDLLPESSFVQPKQVIYPSDFAHLAHKTFSKNQMVWAISCKYSSRGVRYGVDDLPYTISDGPIKWAGYKAKWASYKVSCSGVNRVFYECNLFISREEAKKDAETRNQTIK